MFVSAVQELKAESPISVILFGIVICAKEVQPLKVYIGRLNYSVE